MSNLRLPEYGIWLSPDVARIHPESIEGCLFACILVRAPNPPEQAMYAFSDRKFADGFSAWLKQYRFPHRLGGWGFWPEGDPHVLRLPGKSEQAEIRSSDSITPEIW